MAQKSSLRHKNSFFVELTIVGLSFIIIYKLLWKIKLVIINKVLFEAYQLLARNNCNEASKKGFTKGSTGNIIQYWPANKLIMDIDLLTNDDS